MTVPMVTQDEQIVSSAERDNGEEVQKRYKQIRFKVQDDGQKYGQQVSR